MLSNIPPAHAYADLGSAWFRYQLARIAQRHAQHGRHRRVDVGALLARAAQAARTTVAVAPPRQRVAGVPRAPSAHAGGAPRVPVLAA